MIFAISVCFWHFFVFLGCFFFEFLMCLIMKIFGVLIFDFLCFFLFFCVHFLHFLLPPIEYIRKYFFKDKFLKYGRMGKTKGFIEPKGSRRRVRVRGE